jgi:hypothetical protein
MTESRSEQNTAATAAAKTNETSDETTQRAAAAAVPQKLASIVFIIGDDGELRNIERDGLFDLTIEDGGVVKGTHTRPTLPTPSPNEVTGTLVDNVITLTAPGVREHTGILVGRRFIGVRRPLSALSSQEEGVWVGTKVGP